MAILLTMKMLHVLSGTLIVNCCRCLLLIPIVSQLPNTNTHSDALCNPVSDALEEIKYSQDYIRILLPVHTMAHMIHCRSYSTQTTCQASNTNSCFVLSDKLIETKCCKAGTFCKLIVCSPTHKPLSTWL